MLDLEYGLHHQTALTWACVTIKGTSSFFNASRMETIAVKKDKERTCDEYCKVQPLHRSCHELPFPQEMESPRYCMGVGDHCSLRITLPVMMGCVSRLQFLEL